MNIIRKIIIISFLVFFVSTFFYFFNDNQVRGSLGETVCPGGDDVKGWAWADTIGWISFSCTNESECQTSNYNVEIDDETGDFSGYAWSDAVGWISFEESDLNVEDCPAYPSDCKAVFDSETGEVTGWAKVINSDEWISFNCTNESECQTSDYKVEIDSETMTFSGWAWGDTTIGWISFNCTNQDECETSDYRTYAIPKLEDGVRTKPPVGARSQDGKSVILRGTFLGICDESEADVWFEYAKSEDTITEGTPLTTTPELIEARGSFSSEITFEEDQFGETYYFRAAGEDKLGLGYSKGEILSFTISKGEGQIIIKYGEKEKEIDVKKEGVIETIEVLE